MQDDDLTGGDANASAQTHLERAWACLQLRRVHDAIAAFDAAQSAGGDPDACAAGRWDCYMLLGRFEDAWRESDAIAARNPGAPGRFWDGSPVDGKRVIVRTLHGYGDAVQMIRYARCLRSRAAFLIVETHPPLVEIMRGIPAIDMVTTWGEPAPAEARDWEIQIEVMELPYFFRSDLATIPAHVPYLALPPERVEHSRGLLGAASGPRIGVVWASSVNWNAERSMMLEDMLPVLQVGGFSFYSLQWGEARSEMALRDDLRLHDTAAHSPAVIDTAADIANMDLVITVDTMVAHVAGALGKPVWTLLAEPADWRWMLERSDSPWYPTMRLFRQPRPGDWKSVIDQVVIALEAWKK